MRKLFAYLKGYRKETVLSPLFKLLEACLELIVPLVVARIIDEAIPSLDKTYAVHMCLLLVLLGLVGLVFSVTAQYFAAKAATGLCTRLRQALFDRMQSFSCSSADRMGSATMITRLTGDMNQLQTGFNLMLRLLLRSPFVVLGAAVMAFAVDAEAAMVFLGVIPLLSVVIFGIMLISLPMYKKVQGRLDRVLSGARENLTGVRVIRAFRREKAERQEFYSRNEELTQEQRKVGRITALLNPLTYVIINGAVIVLIYSGALRVDSGELTAGQLVALYNYMSQILVELIKFADLIINVTRAAACGRRIAAVLDMPADDIVSKTPRAPLGGGWPVEFKDVCLRYPGSGGDALSGISFYAPAGSHIGIIGSTGSGKSSLVNLIPRLYTATGGEVTVNGENVADADAGSLRREIGVVPQKIRLFRGSIRDNLLNGNPDATDEDMDAAVIAAQAADVVASKGGLDGMIEQGGRNLSGGQRQRIAIARALVRRPRILILDDSSSALDLATDAALRKSLKAFAEDMTVFTVSQRTSSIAGCDLIIVLEDGKAVGMGDHGSLLRTCEVYREIYESQFKKEDA